MQRSRSQGHLEALGFSPMEAAAYEFLLGESPATAYRVAQGLGKSTANTYKAIDSLIAKGAVMADDSAARLCRAVPVVEVLRQAERAFFAHRNAAAAALSRVASKGRATTDDRVYPLTTIDQVFERGTGLIDRATRLVLLDVFPEVLPTLRPAIDAALGRGVRVALLVYQPVQIDGAEVVLHHRAAEVLRRWPGSWMNVVADSAECVLALLEPGMRAIRHASWTASAFLAHLYDSGLFGEMSSSLLRRALDEDLPLPAIRAAAARLDSYLNLDSAGYATLLEP
jgi:sugar-specific transcriptional regulator TrmB